MGCAQACTDSWRKLRGLRERQSCHPFGHALDMITLLALYSAAAATAGPRLNLAATPPGTAPGTRGSVLRLTAPGTLRASRRDVGNRSRQRYDSDQGHLANWAAHGLPGRETQAAEFVCREASCAQPFCTGPACIQTGPVREHAPHGNGTTLDASWFGG